MKGWSCFVRLHFCTITLSDHIDSPPPGASPQQGGLNAEAWAEGQGYAGQGCLGKPEAIEDEQDRGGRHIAAFPQYRCGGFDRAGG